MAELNGIKGILFDLDGVLYVGQRPIPGANEALRRIRDAGLARRFITNTTTRSQSGLYRQLTQLGFDIAADEVVTAPYAAVLYLRRLGRPRCRLLVNDEVRGDFGEFETVERGPDVVVVGDIGDAWSYGLLNTVFRDLMDGAELVALHRNRFWQTESGLNLDIGCFVAGLEYAAGVEATVVGKPDAAFFQGAVEDMGIVAGASAVIGDDIDSDVGGGQAAGLRGVLVRTGKYRADYAERSTVQPDHTIDSIAELPGLLGV